MSHDTDADYILLDALAVEAGTDKSSISHNYTKIYAKYFSAFKDKPIKFLEIGIFQGNSVKLWENYFSEAELHFIDIVAHPNQYQSGRSHYHYLDQGNPLDLGKFFQESGGQFDVIIDDGGHLMQQQILSFLMLFPALKSGGLYVIEDLHTSYWQEYGGGGSMLHPNPSPGSTIEFLKKIIDDLNYTGARTSCADHNKTPLDIRLNLSYIQESLQSLHFYKSLCIAIRN